MGGGFLLVLDPISTEVLIFRAYVSQSVTDRA